MSLTGIVSRVLPNIPCSSAPKLSNKIMQKGLAFSRDWSGTVVNSGRVRALRDPAPPACWPRWGFGGAARCRHNRMEDLNVTICEEAISCIIC